jgi:hypothetical protein
MILLCGGECAAGAKTGGAFFLLISFGGRSGKGGDRRLEAAARERAQRGLAVEAAGLNRRSGLAAGRKRAALHLV